MCKRQLVQLQKALQKFQDAGIRLVALSYDSVETLQDFARRRNLDYLLLSDSGSRVIDAFGIRHTGFKPLPNQEGIPYPGTFIIDRDGIIRSKLFLEGYVRRSDTDELLKEARKAVS